MEDHIKCASDYRIWLFPFYESYLIATDSLTAKEDVIGESCLH